MSPRQNPHMTAAELREIITELGWTDAFAADYVVRNRRTVRRWLNEGVPIPKEPAQAFDDRSRAIAYELFCRRAESAGA